MSRTLAAVVFALVIGWALTACGNDENGGASAESGDPAGCGGRNALTAEGSTAQQNAMAVFNQVWGEYCRGKNVSYNPTGSGAGRDQFIAGHVDFAGSDSPLVADQIAPAAKRCGQNPAWDLPLVFGPVALTYNLPGAPTLVLTSDVLAKILSGSITTWNDPALVALNRGTALPDIKIRLIYRADSSGTTDNLQKYLTTAAPQSWTKGVGTEFQGGVGEGATRSAGVVQAVRSTRGAFGYVERGFADRAGLPYAQIQTGYGVVPLNNETVRNAINAAQFVADGNDLVLNLNPMFSSHDPHAYPLVQATYEIVCSKGYHPDIAEAIKSFLSVAATTGQTGLASAGYVPLPDTVKARLIAAIDALR